MWHLEHAPRRDEDQPVAVARNPRPAPAHDLAQPAPRSIALDGAADGLAARDESDLAEIARPREPQQESMAAAQGGAQALHLGIVGR